VDLRSIDAEPTAEEREAVDGVLGPPANGWAGGERDIALDGRVARGGRDARERRHLLLPALHALQARVGWISEGGLGYVCRRLTIPPAEAYGVATFYAMFSTAPRPRTAVHVCDDLACRMGGAEELVGQLEASASSSDWAWERSPCLGQCDQAPAIFAQRAGRHDVTLGGATMATVRAVVAPDSTMTCAGGLGAPQAWDGEGRLALRLLRRIGMVDPCSIDDYRAQGGYQALRRAVEIGPEGVIRELKDSRLLGRGGAAFPTGTKWELVATQPVRPHYFVCNADESEPGTFKDRVIMELDPFSVVEALTIAGFATGSEEGFVYLRGEYPLAADRLSNAISAAYARGFLGEDVMGEGFRFDIEIRRGAGAYIAGEETALFNSIEGYRAEPRNKPPFPVTHGLFGKPTGINNVETLINVLEVLRIGGPGYAELGTPDSTGTRLFCLSGAVERPGVYEIECGTRLGDLLELAGGVRGGRALKAILLGGAAGGFVTPDDLDLPLSFEGARDAGVTLGSGVVMVLDEDADLVDTVLRIAAFFRDESCGQCVPCRVGTVRQEEALHRLAAGRTIGSREDELRLLEEIAQVMRDASICGLGQTASSAVLSAISRLGVLA
jgi:NADH-quinone oxidoreductase subunit F